MGIISEFREFAVRGNMVDMAVGIIIGGAFGTIVSSLVSDVIMPPIGHFLLNGIDFSAYKIPLSEAQAGQEAAAINIGTFINHVISFLIVAFAVFLLVKGINNLRAQFEREKAAAPPPEPSAQEKLLAEIRDELRAARTG
ncbi:MAG: large-conductance mechanosensitive channel protein MscL [Hyphomicrobiaceae bacterium]